MKLLFLSEANLRSKLFITDLVHNYSFKEKAILVHDAFGEKLEDTRFVTKRLSALLSESMVVNNAFSGDQRELVLQKGDQLEVKTDFMKKLFNSIQLLILNPIALSETGPALIPAEKLLLTLRAQFPESEVLLFADNGKSPLGVEKALIDTSEDFERFHALYEEESAALNRGLRLRPATIVSPVNYAK